MVKLIKQLKRSDIKERMVMKVPIKEYISISVILSRKMIQEKNPLLPLLLINFYPSRIIFTVDELF